MRKIFFTALVLLLTTPAWASFDRGLGNLKTVYIPKGTFSTHLTVGYNRWNASGEDAEHGIDLVGLVNETSGKVSLFRVNAGASWFFQDNLSLGVRFIYSATEVDIDHLEVMSLLDLSNQHTRRETWSGALAMRGYLPLFDSRILALFCEGRLTGSVGYSKQYEDTERGKEGTYSDLFSARLGLYPGISVFVTNAVSFEVSLPLLEGGLQWDKQIKGQAHESQLDRTFVNFKPGLTGLNAGIVLHF